jgi:hypothetical protein
VTVTRTLTASTILTGSGNSILLNYWQKKTLKIHHWHWSIQILWSSVIFLWWLTLILLISALIISDDEGRDGSQNVGLFIVLPTDMASSPRMFYWVLCQFHLTSRVAIYVPYGHSNIIFLSQYPKYRLPKMFAHQTFYIHYVTVHAWFIQGDSGGICTTLGNDSMSDSKQKSS